MLRGGSQNYQNKNYKFNLLWVLAVKWDKSGAEMTDY